MIEPGENEIILSLSNKGLSRSEAWLRTGAFLIFPKGLPVVVGIIVFGREIATNVLIALG